MKKKTKIMIIITTAVFLVATLYLIILHPRISTFAKMMAVYDEFGGTTNIGLPIEEYNQYSVTDESLVMTDFKTFRIGIPSHMESQTKLDSEYVAYRPLGTSSDNDTQTEAISFNPAGKDSSDMVILDTDLINSPVKSEQLRKGYEELGYGMPETVYDTFKCAYSMQQSDYSFSNYKKSLAFTYLLPFRAGSLFYNNGNTSVTYCYESEDKCGFIRELDMENGFYHYMIEFYDTDELNTGYIIVMTLKDKDLGYAIINSLEFND